MRETDGEVFVVKFNYTSDEYPNLMDADQLEANKLDAAIDAELAKAT